MGIAADSGGRTIRTNGSPPRAWGSLRHLEGFDLHARFTPTCVGIALRGRQPQASTVGSPPRAWGSRVRVGFGDADPRFTPTCVGIALRGRGRRVRRGGSPPRAWGSRTSASFARNCVGSPPRAWGSLVGNHCRTGRTRFTPTCVGIAQVTTGCLGFDAVHPHVRGDRRSAEYQPTRRRAVHPHVRGDRVGAMSVVISCPPVHPHVRGDRDAGRAIARPFSRFTPTCVGIASGTSCSAALAAVHPHVRGDRGRRARDGAWGLRFTPTCVGIAIKSALRALTKYGSPPRAWGSLVRPHERPRRPRFTPTCVGIAPRPLLPQAGRPVHPHVRGDRAVAEIQSGLSTGSPPRAWGSRPRQRPALLRHRFTPTCVGIANRL